MTVVLDTNILVSACWTPGGLEDRVVQMVLAGKLKIAVTPPVWVEYTEVLARRKLAALREKSAHLLARLDALALRVEPGPRVTAAGDEDDNRLLECAIAGSATFLITGNLRDYPAGWLPARIVNARQFLGTLGIIET
jgi:putative PIN family toxin of toxin-antitoxin system